MKTSSPLTSELQDIADSLAEKARFAGLDFFKTVFEIVDYKQLNEIAAYGGFPTRYPHWRFGMEYEQLSKSYTYGLSKIYEMVINNDPCYAYLLRANDLTSQKMVMAHVYGHCDFFKNNLWFAKTNRKMLDQMANHAAIVRQFIDEIGHDDVEQFIDACLSLENLIDPYSVFESPKAKEIKQENSNEEVSLLKSKGYMSKFINPKDFVEEQKKIQFTEEETHHFNPERDILKFLLNNAPLKAWQKRILEIIRDESYYFAPQMQTKILNEGWASYWHSEMMTKLAPLGPAEMIDYCDNHAGVLATPPGGFNPYKLGIELLRHIEDRWNKGQHGLEYMLSEDPKKRENWDKKTNKGREKIFEVRRVHNDITFLTEYFDEDFCHDTKMFLYDYDAKNKRFVISSKEFKPIKAQILKQLTNFGNPVIRLIDDNYLNRKELLLEHQHEGDDLKQDESMQTLKHLNLMWSRPVHINTIIEGQPKRLSFDGQTHSVQKIA